MAFDTHDKAVHPGRVSPHGEGLSHPYNATMEPMQLEGTITGSGTERPGLGKCGGKEREDYHVKQNQNAERL